MIVLPGFATLVIVYFENCSEIDPTFSLFEHEELYEPILKKLKEVDPKTMRERRFFWRRMCEPDIV